MDKLINEISINLNRDCNLAKKLNDGIYFELTKEELINDLELVNSNIKRWKEYIDKKDIKLIIDEYKKNESIISELELCLLDYDEEFNIRDIAFSYYELGNELVNYQKEVNKNE